MNVSDYLNDKKNRPLAVASMCADRYIMAILTSLMRQKNMEMLLLD